VIHLPRKQPDLERWLRDAQDSLRGRPENWRDRLAYRWRRIDRESVLLIFIVIPMGLLALATTSILGFIIYRMAVGAYGPVCFPTL
jgi:type VI protein secretion system component VasF